MDEPHIEKLSAQREEIQNTVAKRWPYFDKRDIEDSFLMALLETLKQVGKGKSIPHVKSYIITTMYHLILRMREKREIVEYDDNNLSRYLLYNGELDLCEQVHLDMFLAVVRQIIDEFKQDDRYLFIARAIESQSFEQIALYLNIPASTARKRFERLRKRILTDPRVQAAR